MIDNKSSNPTIAEAQELYDKAYSSWSHVYEAAKDDLQFYLGGNDQWTAADLKIRESQNRPSLTTNLLPQYVHQVVNDIRSNVPSIKVLPDGNNSDIDTAKIIQGTFKNMEYVYNAPVVYDTAAENQVKCSLGWMRLDHDYDDVETFDELKTQHICLKRVVNPLSVIIDPTSVEADGSDAEYGFVLDEYTPAQFKKLWPRKLPMSFYGTESRQDDEMIVVAEFFKIVKEDVEIVQLQDGSILTAEKAQQLGETPVKTKTIEKKKVKRYRMSGADILEETYFPGEYVPLVPVYGEEHWIEGKRYLFSLVRWGKDPQRMVNYYASLETELLQKSPQAPFMAAEGQLEGHEDDWRNPGSKMVLQYKTTDINGKDVPAPIRMQPPPVPVGVVQARQSCIQDMRDAMGIQQAGLGQKSNETSGVAIAKRAHEGDMANMHFGDNLNRSICHVGRIYISMLPEIYDTPRLMKIMNDEGDIQSIGVNGMSMEEQNKVYDLTVGTYNVSVVAGPSFTTRRQETQDLMMKVMQTNPQLVQVMGDLFFKYSDMPGADVIAARLKKTIPPQLTAGEDNNEKIPPGAQQQIMQMEQQIKQDQAKLQGMTSQMVQLHQQNIELNLANQNKQGELKIKEQELGIKQGELQIKTIQANTEAATAQSKTGQADAPDPIEDIKLHLDVKKELFDQQMKEREMTLKEDEMKLKIQQARLAAIEAMQTRAGKLEGDAPVSPSAPEMEVLNGIDAVLQTMDKGIGTPKAINMDIAGKSDIQPILHSLGALHQAMQKIHEGMNKPRTHQIVRDADGNMQAVMTQ